MTATDDLGPASSLLRRSGARLAERAVLAGAPPAAFGWRWARETSLSESARRDPEGRAEEIHAPAIAENPLPLGESWLRALPDGMGDFFGFTLRDVPRRPGGATWRATLSDATLAAHRDARGQYWPAVVDRAGRALRMREVRFRPDHGAALRDTPPERRPGHTAWIAERVYENHAHWVTAHLPKLCLLERDGGLDDLALPTRRTPAIAASLRMFGRAPESVPAVDALAAPVRFERLTLFDTDRLRPALLRLARDRLARPAERRDRRLFVTRAGARGRRLVNEPEVSALLAAFGFETVAFEAMTFEEQVAAMGAAQTVVAPHGAGLANILFCQPETHVVEIADWSYPNPNFYAMAAALGLPYQHVPARFDGGDPAAPLLRDMTVDLSALRRALARIADG